MMYHGKYSNAFNYISEKYIFRYNVVTNFYEFSLNVKKKKQVWIKYDDRYRSEILLNLMTESIDVPTEKVNIFIESKECSPDYNPFEEYFENLKKHKGKRDYIKEFANTVTTNNDKRFLDVFRRFLISSVDCLLNADSVNDVCLVFQSGQGVGKTRWMRSLLPKQFQDEYLYEGNIDTKNKDHTMYLSQYWFIHLDELETLRSNNIAAIKSYITQRNISLRKAYGRYKTNFVRRASFLGSVNEDKFLSDTTGNRRWLVFQVSKINYTHGLNPDNLWAQVYDLWKKGDRHWFDIKEIKEINKTNEEFRIISLEEELLLRYFIFNDKEDKGEMLSSSEAIQKIILNAPSFSNKLETIRMGKALSKHSRHKVMKSGVQRYYLDYIGIEDDFKPTENESKDDLPF